MTRIAESSGVLVARAWVEGAAGGLRVRITQSRGSAVDEQVEMVAANVGEVLVIVRDWLEALLTDARESN
jgi:hypothetical protein